MTVRIRLDSHDRAALDAHVGALQVVLDVVGEPSRRYPDRNGGGGTRRYLVSAGTRMSAATAAAVAAANRGDGLGPAPLEVAEDAKARRDIVGEVDALMAADEELRGQPWMPLQAGDLVLSYLPGGDGATAYGATYVATGDGDLLQLLSSTQFDADEEKDLPEFLLVSEDHGKWRIDAAMGEPELSLWRTSRHRGFDGLLEAQAWAVEEINADTADTSGEVVTGWVQYDERSWRPLLGDEDADDVSAGVPSGAGESFYELWFESPAGSVTVIRAGAVVFGRPAVAS